jgi:hypothetical protein
MMAKSVCTLLIILSINWSDAQAQYDSATLKSIYEKEVIYFSGGKYVKNDVKYKVKNLASEFKPNTPAFDMYLAHKADYHNGRFYAAAGLGLYIAGIIISDKNKIGGYGLLVSGPVATSFSLHFRLRADKKMRKAVWLRNQDVLLQRY